MLAVISKLNSPTVKVNATSVRVAALSSSVTASQHVPAVHQICHQAAIYQNDQTPRFLAGADWVNSNALYRRLLPSQ